MLWQLTRRDLIRQSGGSRGATPVGLGLSLVRPILVGLALWVGLRPFLNASVPRYPLFLVVGLCHWHLWSGATQMGCQALRANANLLSKIYFPRWVLPASALLTQCIRIQIVWLVFLLTLYRSLGGQIWWGWWLYPLGLSLFLLFTLGLCLGLSVAQVYAEDTREVLSLSIQLSLWLSPILYPLSHFSAGTQVMLSWLNPLLPFLNFFHSLFYRSVLPDGACWLGMLSWSALALGLGVWLFARLQAEVTDWL